MGTYNLTSLSMTCPRCGRADKIDIALHFGLTAHMQRLSIGDVYPFFPRRAPRNGGPTECGEGYAVCPHCDRDFFCAVHIKDGRLAYAEVDRGRLAYVPDSERASVGCPLCSAPLRVQTFAYLQLENRFCDADSCSYELRSFPTLQEHE